MFESSLCVAEKWAGMGSESGDKVVIGVEMGVAYVCCGGIIFAFGAAKEKRMGRKVKESIRLLRKGVEERWTCRREKVL